MCIYGAKVTRIQRSKHITAPPLGYHVNVQWFWLYPSNKHGGICFDFLQAQTV